MPRIAAWSCLSLLACLLAGDARADPISRDDLTADRRIPRVESFEGIVGIEFPGDLLGGGYGAPPTGFEFGSGLVLRSPDPNDVAGLLVGDFDVRVGLTYGLGTNGVINDLCDVLPRSFPALCNLNAAYRAGGTAFAGTGTEDAGEIVFGFPVAVQGFGFSVSTYDDSPLTLRSYDAYGELIETWVVTDTEPVPLRDESFVGLDSPPDRPIDSFSIEGGFYAFDEVLFLETLGCTSQPQPLCKTSVTNGSKLKLKSKKGKLLWKYKNGAETDPIEFGALRAGGGVSICLYASSEGEPALVAEATVPADEQLWQENSKGFTYKDKEGSHDGIVKIKLQGSDEAKAKILVKGKNMALPATPLAEDPSVLIQLKVQGGGCFQNEFPGPAKKNDAKGYKGFGG